LGWLALDTPDVAELVEEGVEVGFFVTVDGLWVTWDLETLAAL